jgi:hypothetical protein
VTIKNSISITGVEGASIDMNGGNAISVSIGAGSAAINLANLVIQNISGSGTNGISVNVGLASVSVTITHCTIRGFNFGIGMGGTTTVSFLIADTVVTNNQTGLVLDRAYGILDHVIANLNKVGVSASRATVTAIDTMATNNSASPFDRHRNWRGRPKRWQDQQVSAIIISVATAPTLVAP